MQIRFIGQGYNNQENSSVAKVLIESLEDNRFHTFKCLIAFASYAGVNGLKQHIINSKSHISNFKIVVGIDQEGTSKEALESLLEWEVNCFVYYTSQRIIFHPKIYLFEGDDNVRIIVGSNNLTQTGLGQNIEGALDYTFSKSTIDSNNNVLNQITDYYSHILSESEDSPNLKRLTAELIDLLVNSGLVPTEASRRVTYHKGSDSQNDDTNDELATIRELFPSIPIQRLPNEFRPPRSARVVNTAPLNSQSNQNERRIVADDWTFGNDNQILVAEIGGPSRWKQISFAQRNFQTFFELPVAVGEHGTIQLKYIEDDYSIENVIEHCTSARVKASSNYNLEPEKVRDSAIRYDRNNRPIIFFIKINATNFIYRFEAQGTTLYNELQEVLSNDTRQGLRRIELTLSELRNSCHSLGV